MLIKHLGRIISLPYYGFDIGTEKEVLDLRVGKVTAPEKRSLHLCKQRKSNAEEKK